MNASWQKQIDTLQQWKGTLTNPLQNSFYPSKVEAEFQSNRSLKHVVVIISDALRYEAGWDLYNQAQKLDKVKASIQPNGWNATQLHSTGNGFSSARYYPGN